MRCSRGSTKVVVGREWVGQVRRATYRAREHQSRASRAAPKLAGRDHEGTVPLKKHLPWLWTRYRCWPMWAQVGAGIVAISVVLSPFTGTTDSEVRTSTTDEPTTTAEIHGMTTVARRPETTPASTSTTLSPRLSALPAGDDTTVSRVIDGDTIVVANGTTVRLIGMDTPETKDPRRPVGCFGAEAARRTGELTGAGTRVRLVYDVERTDRYGRTLAYVYRLDDGVFVNAALLQEGFAQVATYPPNVAHVEEFLSLQRQAREAGVGLWGACPMSKTVAPTSGAVSSAPALGNCDSSYPDFCISSPPPDLDCPDLAQENFTVRQPDPHGFDGNRDGVGCQSSR